MIFICAVKTGAATKAAAKPRLVQWQKAAPQKNCLRVVREEFFDGKVVENGLIFLLLGFCTVGTSLDEISDLTWPRKAHNTPKGGAAHAQLLWVPWKQQIIHCCLYKAGGKDEECLSQSIGGENLFGNAYRQVMPVWSLWRAQEAQLLLPCSSQKSSPGLSRGCRAVPPAKEPRRKITQVLSYPFQVFLELSREQEKENFDLTLDGAFDWKRLQQEDC